MNREDDRQGVPEPPPAPPPGSAADRFARSMEIDYSEVARRDRLRRRDPGARRRPGDRAEIERLLLGRGIPRSGAMSRRWPRWARRPRTRRCAKRSGAATPASTGRCANTRPSSCPTASEWPRSSGRWRRRTSTRDSPRALREVESLHPPEVVQALLLGARDRAGEVAVHFAAMLLYLHGKAREPPSTWLSGRSSCGSTRGLPRRARARVPRAVRADRRGAAALEPAGWRTRQPADASVSPRAGRAGRGLSLDPGAGNPRSAAFVHRRRPGANRHPPKHGSREGPRPARPAPLALRNAPLTS